MLLFYCALETKSWKKLEIALFFWLHSIINWLFCCLSKQLVLVKASIVKLLNNTILSFRVAFQGWVFSGKGIRETLTELPAHC